MYIAVCFALSYAILVKSSLRNLFGAKAIHSHELLFPTTRPLNEVFHALCTCSFSRFVHCPTARL